MPERFNPLETKYPIWNAGMGGGLAGPELVASVSESGCFGVLGTGGLASESVGQLIKETRQLTSIPLDELMYSRDVYAAVGAVFRLTENDLIKKMEQLIMLLPGVFEIRDTAGIYQLYLLKEVTELELLSVFYGKELTEVAA